MPLSKGSDQPFLVRIPYGSRSSVWLSLSRQVGTAFIQIGTNNGTGRGGGWREARKGNKAKRKKKNALVKRNEKKGKKEILKVLPRCHHNWHFLLLEYCKDDLSCTKCQEPIQPKAKPFVYYTGTLIYASRAIYITLKIN